MLYEVITLFVPYLTWEEIKPKIEVGTSNPDLIFNLIAVQLEDPQTFDIMAQRLEEQIDGVEAVDRQTAYESTPGYGPQQSTLNTQRIFTMIIGVLVVGGFFQMKK